MASQVDEKVNVGAVFKNGRVFPRWFLHRDQKVSVETITYSWQERKGDSIYYHYAVSDGENLYDLSFHPGDLVWILEAVEDEY